MMSSNENVKFHYVSGGETFSFEGGESALYRLLDAFSPGSYFPPETEDYDEEFLVDIDLETDDWSAEITEGTKFKFGDKVRVDADHTDSPRGFDLSNAVGTVVDADKYGPLVKFTGLTTGHHGDKDCWWVSADRLSAFDGYRAGDRVVAVSEPGGNDKLAGKTGTVVHNDHSDFLPVQVEFGCYVNSHGDTDWWCETESLEFILEPVLTDDTEDTKDTDGDAGNASEPVVFQKGDIVKVVSNVFEDEYYIEDYGEVCGIRTCKFPIGVRLNNGQRTYFETSELELTYRPTGDEPPPGNTRFPQFRIGDVVSATDHYDSHIGVITKDDGDAFAPLWADSVCWEPHELTLLYRSAE